LPEGQWRALNFFALIAAILALILVNRSFSASFAEAFSGKNRALLIVVGIVSSVTALIMTVAPARTFLKFDMLDPVLGGVAIGTGICVLIMLEGIKPFAERRWFGDQRQGLAPRRAM